MGTSVNQYACPVTSLSESFRLTNSQLEGVLLAARVNTPVTYLPDIDFWAVTRYEEIKEVLADRNRYSASIALDPIERLSPEVLEYLKASNFNPKPLLVPNDDVEEHAKVRRHTQIGFGPRRLKQIEPAIRDLVDRFIDDLIRSKPADLVGSMLYELPAIVLFRVLGVDDDDVGNVKRWADNRLLLTFGRLPPDAQMAAARELVDYWRYSISLVDKKANQPANDLPSMMLNAQVGDDHVLTRSEIANVVFGLLLAGHETTTNLSANSIQYLLENRSAWQRLVGKPDEISAAVEELIRLRPPVIAWRRKTRVPVTICGTDIPAGAKLLLYLASGNRDEAIFEEPGRFDPARGNVRSHLSFGFGAHFCLGAPLARLELRLILERLTARLPGLRLVEPSRQPDVVETIVFRGPKELWVTW